MTRLRTLTTLSMAALVLGCGSSDSAADRATGEAAATTPARSNAPAPVMGSFELPDSTLAFRVIKCDLTGGAPDGILLRGSGTLPDGSLLLPDGRTMLIEVERLAPHMGGEASAYERATVQFGNFMDEDGWEATATTFDGTRWMGDNDALGGPIIQVSGNDLIVTAAYGHASRDEQIQATLRVTCPRPTYP